MSSRFKQMVLLFGDGALLYLSLFSALTLRYGRLPSNDGWNLHWPVFSFVFFIWLTVFYLAGLYDLKKTKNNAAFFRSFLGVAAVNLLLAVGFFYIYDSTRISPKTILILLVGLNLPLFAAWRGLAHRLLRASTLKTRLLFLGLTAEAMELVKTFEREPQIGYKPIAVLAEPSSSFLNEAPAGIERLDSLDGLLDYIKDKKIDTVVAAVPALNEPLKRLLYQTIFLRVSVIDIVSFYENITHRVPVSALSEIWFLENLKESQKRIYDLMHRLADYLLALLMTALFLVFWAPAALAIYLCDRGAIFHRQTRVGKDGKIFTIYKFRTMIPQAEAHGTRFTQKNDWRITKTGRILRILHLDELPQFANILKGEMSAVGPRPERPEFVAELQKMMPFYQTRHLIRPGLTGWAQTNYEYADSLPGNLVKLQYDLYYIKNRSLFLDAVILLKTIKAAAGKFGR